MLFKAFNGQKYLEEVAGLEKSKEKAEPEAIDQNEDECSEVDGSKTNQ